MLSDDEPVVGKTLLDLTLACFGTYTVLEIEASLASILLIACATTLL